MKMGYRGIFGNSNLSPTSSVSWISGSFEEHVAACILDPRKLFKEPDVGDVVRRLDLNLLRTFSLAELQKIKHCRNLRSKHKRLAATCTMPRMMTAQSVERPFAHEGR